MYAYEWDDIERDNTLQVIFLDPSQLSLHVFKSDTRLNKSMVIRTSSLNINLNLSWTVSNFIDAYYECNKLEPTL